MTPAEIKVIKELTKTVGDLNRTLMQLPRKLAVAREVRIDVPADSLIEAQKAVDNAATEVDNAVKDDPTVVTPVKLPAYLMPNVDIPVDERTSNGFAKVHQDHVEIHLPRHLAPDVAEDILEAGQIFGFDITILHRKKV